MNRDLRSKADALVGYESRRHTFRVGKQLECSIAMCRIIPKKFTREEKRVPKKIGANAKKKSQK